MKRPDLSDPDRMVGAQATGRVDASRGHVQLEGHMQPPQGHPLGQGFQMIDRLRRLDLDHPEELSAALGRLKDKVGKNGRVSRGHRDRLYGARIDARFEFSLELRLQQTDDPVVLELLADGPH